MGQFLKLPALFKLTNTEPFAAWFAVTGNATPDGIRIVWSVLGAISQAFELELARADVNSVPPPSLNHSQPDMNKIYRVASRGINHQPRWLVLLELLEL